MLKLYTNKEFLTEKNRSYVFPLLFDLFFSNDSVLSNDFKIVDSLEESDVAVLPLEYGFSLLNDKKKLKTFITKAKLNKKPIWIYTGGDYGYSINDIDVFNFRLGGFKSKLNSRTIVLPSFITDPYVSQLKNKFKPLEKELVPKIGFVGHAKGGTIKYIKEFISFLKLNIKRVLKKEYADYQPFYPSGIKRASYLQQLKKNNNIQTNFILRDKYRAGVKMDEDKAETTKEFYNNIYESPYTFCIRGGGNFSVRFYETLAVGRIPVLLDTDCLLPLSNLIDWSQHALIIQNSDETSISEEIINFHSKISSQDFKNLQIKNKKLWESYLTRHTFFRHIHDAFINKELVYEG